MLSCAIGGEDRKDKLVQAQGKAPKFDWGGDSR
jgi:hypothetical protein